MMAVTLLYVAILAVIVNGGRTATAGRNDGLDVAVSVVSIGNDVMHAAARVLHTVVMTD